MNILATGENGKVVQAFCNYVKENYNDIKVECLSLRGDGWKSKNLSEYDCVYHCVGLVKGEPEQLFEINRDLTKEFAEKAKNDGVKKFIYLSSMAVYGLSANVSNKPITAGSSTISLNSSVNKYGASKLAGEMALLELSDDNFKVRIIRAPSIYGRNTERYFDGYFKFMKLGIFIDGFKSWKRSIIYIDNLSEFILCVCKEDAEESIKYYFPQNKEMLSVSEIVKEIAEAKSRKVWFVKLPGFVEKVLSKQATIGAVFAPIMYEYEISNIFDYKYCVVSVDESIKKTLEN